MKNQGGSILKSVGQISRLWHPVAATRKAKVSGFTTHQLIPLAGKLLHSAIQHITRATHVHFHCVKEEATRCHSGSTGSAVISPDTQVVLHAPDQSWHSSPGEVPARLPIGKYSSLDKRPVKARGYVHSSPPRDPHLDGSAMVLVPGKISGFCCLHWVLSQSKSERSFSPTERRAHVPHTGQFLIFNQNHG